MPFWPKAGQCAATGSSSPARPRSICCQRATEANGLVAGEEREERVRPHRLAALGVGVAAGEVEDEAAVAIDGERRAREEPQRAELFGEEALDL